MAACKVCMNGMVGSGEDAWCPTCEFPDLVPHKPIFVETCRQSNPNVSEALGVHTDTIPEFMEDARKRGVPTEFDKLGRPMFTSRRHKNDYARSYGMHNNDEVL